MTTIFVVLISVLCPLAYLTVGAMAGGLAYRSLSHACTPHPNWVKYPDIYTTPHYDHFHGPAAAAIGLFWPVAWTLLLARHMALLPTADERSKALGQRIKELEAELKIGGAL